jgi:hypothetical protein
MGRNRKVPGTLSRRDFLKVGGTGLAGAALLGAAGAANKAVARPSSTLPPLRTNRDRPRSLSTSSTRRTRANTESSSAKATLIQDSVSTSSGPSFRQVGRTSSLQRPSSRSSGHSKARTFRRGRLSMRTPRYRTPSPSSPSQERLSSTTARDPSHRTTRTCPWR